MNIIITIIVLFLLAVFVLFAVLRAIFARMVFWDSRLREASRQRMTDQQALDWSIHKSQG